MIDIKVKYCQYCGLRLKMKFHAGRERPTCPECKWIFYPDPKVAITALIENDNQVLLVRRGNNPQRGLWTLPGGFLDAGEHPYDAVVRECFEETGLRVKIIQFLDVISGQEHPRGAHIILVYLARITSGNMISGDDVDRVSFFAFDALPPLAFRSTITILKKHLELFSG